jgi:hypothetical protein
MNEQELRDLCLCEGWIKSGQRSVILQHVLLGALVTILNFAALYVNGGLNKPPGEPPASGNLPFTGFSVGLHSGLELRYRWRPLG